MKAPAIPQTSVAARIASVPNFVRAMVDPIGGHDSAMRAIDDAKLLQLVAVRPLDELAPDVAERAKRRADALPSWDVLRGWAKSLDAALEESPEEERTRVLLALLLDGFTRRVPSPETWLDAAVFLLAEDRLGPGLVSTACRRLWTERRTPPPVGDIVAAARAARSSVGDARVLVQRAFAARQRAEAIVARAAA